MSMRLRLLFATAAASAMVCLSADAIFVHVDVVDVPVDRLVANLEALIVKEPAVVQHRVNLARAHAMAFALKSGTVQVVRGQESRGPVRDPLRENVQPTVKPADDALKLEQARKHLAEALRRYDEAINMDPKHALARLGYGWALHQSGDTAGAMTAYRAAIEAAWPQERSGRTVAFRGWVSITEEAGRLLIPLLDPAKDRDEIALLRQRTEELQRMPRAITPIVIPLRDGLSAMDLADESASVRFDADGTGLQRRWTWVTPEAGWLVFDPQNRGTVQSALQMFGNVTFWLFWANGYEAMRALDDDADGTLRGRELQGLAVWRDINRDAVSGRGEVLPLANWQITELSYRYEFDASHPDEIAFVRSGVLFADGTSRPTYDLLLHRK